MDWQLLLSDPRVVAMMAHVRDWGRDFSRGIELLCSLHTDDANGAQAVEERIEAAYRLLCDMRPEPQDLMAMLMAPDYLARRVTLHIFALTFSEAHATALHGVLYDTEKESGECGLSVPYLLRMRVFHGMYADFYGTLNRRRPDTALVDTAMQFSEEVLFGREDARGMPRLLRPLQLAQRLFAMDAGGAVLSAALLHGITEDGACTLQDIDDRCGKQVADYVGACVSLRDACMKGDRPLTEQQYRDISGAIADRPAFHFALCIEATDELLTLEERLRTAEADGEEAESRFLPLLLRLDINGIAEEMDELLWHAKDVFRYQAIRDRYAAYRKSCEASTAAVAALLREYGLPAIHRHAGHAGGGFELTLRERPYRPYEICRMVRDADEGTAGKDVLSYIDKSHLPVCDFDIIADPRGTGATRDMLFAGFAKLSRLHEAMPGLCFTALYEKDGAYVFELEDRYRCTYRVRLMSRRDHRVRQLGIDYSVFTEVEEEKKMNATRTIVIRLKNGKPIQMPRGSTVIDVAFAISPALGYALRGGWVNGEEVEPKYVLSEGDHVVVDADTQYTEESNTRRIPYVRIEWLDIVATKKARKLIMEFLIRYHEGNNPEFEKDASDTDVQAVADSILDMLKD